jgi:hypothetical protein
MTTAEQLLFAVLQQILAKLELIDARAAALEQHFLGSGMSRQEQPPRSYKTSAHGHDTLRDWMVDQ